MRRDRWRKGAGPAVVMRDVNELIRAAVAGERAAFDELVVRHREQVFATAYRMVANAEAAEEIAQFVRYDYLVINDDFDQAVRELEAILIAEQCKRRQRTDEAGEILESFR